MTELTSLDRRFKLVYEVDQNNIFLRDFLAMKEISKRTLTAIKYDGGNIYVNNIERDVRFKLQEGDQVKIFFPEEQKSTGLHAQEGPLEIVFEDDSILILNKQPEQSTIPSQGHRLGTVANFVADKFIKDNIPATVHIVTRLDFNTSGLICIAKNRHVHHLLGLQMNTASFHREYEAIVEGTVKQNEFTITKKIGRKDGSIIERVIREDGKNAQTNVKVLRRFSIDEQELTRVTLVLQTGRTHQIRVHMQSIGHPLAGDDLYGGSKKLISRHALHCTLLQFYHPITGKKMQFKSDVFDDMKHLIK